MCGCGTPVTRAKQSCTRRGHVNGEFIRFVSGHNRRITTFRPGPRHYDVNLAGCWIWKGALNSWGYGRTTVNGRRVRAHRAYYEHFVGPVPPSLELDHLCRNRACVNPDHLEPVTHAENMRRAQFTRLTTARVIEIRAEHARRSGRGTMRSVAREFAPRWGVSERTLEHVIAGIGWDLEAAA